MSQSPPLSPPQSATPGSGPGDTTPGNADPRVARTTGLLYLGLALTGMLGFLLVRPALYVAGDPVATLGHLVDQAALARVGVALEMGIVVTQALAALWFYRLFRPVDAFAAGAIAVFGLVNAVAILASAAALGTAVQVAAEPFGDSASAVQLMYLVSNNLWGVGALFFGLWLVPMGWCVLRSGWMPRPLGWILVAGGAGYVLSAFVSYLAPEAGVVADALAVPASVGEFWMIGWLLLTRKTRRTDLA
ncbi:MAG: DUF4386 domain-containing protein [Nocardioides sp.]